MKTRPPHAPATPAATGGRLFGALLALALPTLSPCASTGTSSIGDSYELDAQIVGAGGAMQSGANGLSAEGLVGQNNSAALSGSNGYSAVTGFWAVAAQGGAGDRIFRGDFDSTAVQ